MFDQFAEGLGGQIHAREEHVAGLAPSSGAAFENKDGGIALRLKALCRTLSYTGRAFVAAVIDDHAHRLAGHQAGHVDFQAAEGQRRGVEQMGLTVLTMLAHVEHGNFLAVVQPVLEGGRGY